MKLGLLEEMTDSWTGEGRAEMSLEHLIVPGSMECSKNVQDMPKGHRSHLEGALTA